MNYIAVTNTDDFSSNFINSFLEHDDGNRALMGSNMQRQAVRQFDL
jgi:DNA-directed RNA polymerase beta subunit